MINHNGNKFTILTAPKNLDKVQVLSNRFVDGDLVYILPNNALVDNPSFKTYKDLFREIRTMRGLVKSLRRIK